MRIYHTSDRRPSPAVTAAGEGNITNLPAPNPVRLALSKMSQGKKLSKQELFDIKGAIPLKQFSKAVMPMADGEKKCRDIVSSSVQEATRKMIPLVDDLLAKNGVKADRNAALFLISNLLYQIYPAMADAFSKE